MTTRTLTVLLLTFLVIETANVSGSWAAENAGVRVRVFDGNGAPVYAAAVSLRPLSGDHARRTLLTDAAGFADFGVLAAGAAYAIEVDTLAGKPRHGSAPLPAGRSGVINIQLDSVRTQTPHPFMASTALPSTSFMAVASTYERMPAAVTLPEPRSDDTFAATLGFRFGSSAFDGTGAPSKDSFDDPEFETFHPWLRVSGALTSGRVWYRLAQDVVRDEQPVDVGSGILIQTRRQSSFTPRIAWQVAPRNRLSLEYQRHALEQDHLGVSSILGTGASASVDSDVDVLALTWVAPVSATQQVEGSLRWRQAEEHVFPSERGRNNDCISDQYSLSFLEGSPCRSLRSQRTSGAYFLDVDANTESLKAHLQLTVRDLHVWGMDQVLRAGITVENERHARTLESRPRIEHEVLRPFRDPDSAAVFVEDIHLLSTTLDLHSVSAARVRGVTANLYFEDAIRPRDNLALTLGALVERSERSGEGWTPFDPRSERTRFFELQATGMSATDIFALGTFTAYEGIDRLGEDLVAATQDPRFYSQPQGVLETIPPRLQESALWPTRRMRDNIELTSTRLLPYLSLDWDPWANGKSRVAIAARRGHDTIPLQVLAIEQDPTRWNLQFFGFPLQDRIVPTNFAIGPEGSTRTVSRDLRPAAQLEYVLTLEREVSTSTRVRLQWINRRYRDQLRSHDINQVPGDFGRCQAQPPFGSVNPLVESPGSGFELIDLASGGSYVDTDPGMGDGRLDDCRGRTFLSLPFYLQDRPPLMRPRDSPDGRPDLYKQNPAWGSVITVDNSARSDYEAVVLELIRHQQESWQFFGSYIWSRHRGNYDRLATFDELDPTVSDGAVGYQSNDRRHTLQLEATTRIGAFRLAGRASWKSGLPYSILEQALFYDTIPPAYDLFDYAVPRNRLEYSGDRNRERNSGQYLLDVMATRTFLLRPGSAIEIALTVDNLFDDETYRVYNPDFATGVQINGINGVRREFGRRWQLSLAANW